MFFCTFILYGTTGRGRQDDVVVFFAVPAGVFPLAERIFLLAGKV